MMWICKSDLIILPEMLHHLKQWLQLAMMHIEFPSKEGILSKKHASKCTTLQRTKRQQQQLQNAEVNTKWPTKILNWFSKIIMSCFEFKHAHTLAHFERHININYQLPTTGYQNTATSTSFLLNKLKELVNVCRQSIQIDKTTTYFKSQKFITWQEACDRW